MDEPLITLEEAAKIIRPSRASHLHPRRVIRRWCEEGVVENGQRIVLEHVRFGANDLKTTTAWVVTFGRERALARRSPQRSAAPLALAKEVASRANADAEAILRAAGI